VSAATLRPASCCAGTGASIAPPPITIGPSAGAGPGAGAGVGAGVGAVGCSAAVGPSASADTALRSGSSASPSPVALVDAQPATVLSPQGRSREAWRAWEAERARQQHERRVEYLHLHTSQMAEGKTLSPSALSDEAFAKACLATLRAGVAAVRLLGIATPLPVRLAAPPDADHLTWETINVDGTVGTGGQMRIVEILDVHYGAALAEGDKIAHPGVPVHTRFRLLDTSGSNMQFAIANPQQLQHVVCGLRHLVHRPMQRGQILWQRFEHTLPAGRLSAFGFDQRLEGGVHTESLRSRLLKFRSQNM